jgi:hypothetical protein
VPPPVGVFADTPRLVRTLQDMSPRARQPVAAAQRLSLTQPELQCKGPEWHVRLEALRVLARCQLPPPGRRFNLRAFPRARPQLAQGKAGS